MFYLVILTNMITQIITKEAVHQIKFSSEDVLNTELEKMHRTLQLDKAMKLGNSYKLHVSIYFRGTNGEFLKTIATVWAVTEKYLVLKGNTLIPIHSIYDIDFISNQESLSLVA